VIALAMTLKDTTAAVPELGASLTVTASASVASSVMSTSAAGASTSVTGPS